MMQYIIINNKKVFFDSIHTDIFETLQNQLMFDFDTKSSIITNMQFVLQHNELNYPTIIITVNTIYSNDIKHIFDTVARWANFNRSFLFKHYYSSMINYPLEIILIDNTSNPIEVLKDTIFLDTLKYIKDSWVKSVYGKNINNFTRFKTYFNFNHSGN